MSNKVSIVIAWYNDPSIIDAIKSAYNQTYSDKEIIVVDDGSNLENKKLLSSVTDQVDILITQENKGQSNARNNGISRATGKYILNLDSDDFFENSFCEKAVAIFERDSQVKIVTCKANRFDNSGMIDVFTPQGGGIENFLYSNSALGSSMFRKNDWEVCGGYEEVLPILGFEDWEFYIRLLKDGGHAHVIQEDLFNYQVRKGSTTDRIKDQKQEKYQEIILKHRDLYISNFNGLVIDFSQKIKKLEREKKSIKTEIDYKIGNILLAPVRKLKRTLKLN